MAMGILKNYFQFKLLLHRHGRRLYNLDRAQGSRRGSRGPRIFSSLVIPPQNSRTNERLAKENKKFTRLVVHIKNISNLSHIFVMLRVAVALLLSARQIRYNLSPGNHGRLRPANRIPRIMLNLKEPINLLK